MLRSKVGQRVVIHVHTATNPFVGIAVIAPPTQFAGFGDALLRGIEPQCHQHPRVCGRTSGMAFHGFDLRVQRRQVQFLNQLPNRARWVVGGNQIVNPFRIGIDLRAVWRLHPRRLGRCLRASILLFHDCSPKSNVRAPPWTENALTCSITANAQRPFPSQPRSERRL
jgi:hypothetical protein